MTRTLIWRKRARQDLIGLHDWIESRADGDVAARYVRAVVQRAEKLIDLPFGGSPRPDLGKSIRSVAHRRRTVVIYLITEHTLEILRIAHRGRDPRRMFPAND